MNRSARPPDVLPRKHDTTRTNHKQKLTYVWGLTTWQKLAKYSSLQALSQHSSVREPRFSDSPCCFDSELAINKSINHFLCCPFRINNKSNCYLLWTIRPIDWHRTYHWQLGIYCSTHLVFHCRSIFEQSGAWRDCWREGLMPKRRAPTATGRTPNTCYSSIIFILWLGFIFEKKKWIVKRVTSTYHWATDEMIMTVKCLNKTWYNARAPLKGLARSGNGARAEAFARDEMRVGQATETPSPSASSSYLICRSTVIGALPCWRQHCANPSLLSQHQHSSKKEKRKISERRPIRWSFRLSKCVSRNLRKSKQMA